MKNFAISHSKSYNSLLTGVYVGLIVSAPNLICPRWFLPNEKNMAITISYSGINLGAMLFATAGVVNDKLGWEYSFRLPGLASIVCGLLFVIFYTDDPSENVFISYEEAKRLRPTLVLQDQSAVENLGQSSLVERKESKGLLATVISMNVARRQKRKAAPLLQALTYAPVWAVLSGTFGVAWAYEAVVNYTQFYLIEMHDFSLKTTSLLNSV